MLVRVRLAALGAVALGRRGAEVVVAPGTDNAAAARDPVRPCPHEVNREDADPKPDEHIDPPVNSVIDNSEKQATISQQVVRLQE